MVVRWTGSLTWGDALVRLREGAHLARGQYWIGRSDVAVLEPNLQDLPEQAVYTPTDGGVDPARTTEALVHAARTLGGRLGTGGSESSLPTLRSTLFATSGERDATHARTRDK